MKLEDYQVELLMQLIDRVYQIGTETALEDEVQHIHVGERYDLFMENGDNDYHVRMVDCTRGGHQSIVLSISDMVESFRFSIHVTYGEYGRQINIDDSDVDFVEAFFCYLHVNCCN